MALLNDLYDLFLLGRVHFVLGGFLLFSLGAALALADGHAFDLSRFAFCYAVTFLAHLSISYSNDYFDAESDKHTTARLFSGGSHVLVRRPELARPAAFIAIGLMFASIALSFVGVFALGLSPLFVTLVCVGAIFGWAYSAPPFRLSGRGLGEVATASAAGILLPVVGNYAVSLSVTPSMLLFIPAMLCYGLAFVISVQLPDSHADTLSGKWGFVVRAGVPAGFFSAAVLCALASTHFFVSLWLTRAPLLSSVFFASLLPAAVFMYPVVRSPSDSRVPLFSTLAVASLFLFFFAAAFLVSSV